MEGLKPKLSEVQKYVRPHVAERWEDVGYALCLADSDDGKRMDEIKEEKKGEANSCFNEIMKLWLRSGSLCTWSTLITAIKSVWGLEAVGAQIEAQILAKKTTPSLCQANSQPTNCSPQQQSETHTIHPIDEDNIMDCQAECPNTGTTTGIGESSEPVLPTGLTAEPEELELTIDYSIKLEGGKKVREYQKELAEPGIKGENYIVVAPTGSGKTLVVALIISDHLQKNQHNDDGHNVLFIVNT